MKAPYPVLTMASDQDERISDAVRTEQARLRNFIRRRVPDAGDAEDILQDVFYELVEAYRSMETIEQMGAWLFRVARNRIIDLFRKKRPVLLIDEIGGSLGEDESIPWEELVPSADAGPEEVLLRSAMLEGLEDALDELPDEQRQVFFAHEVEGQSFKEIAEETGVAMNTLLSRKRYAVLHLRKRLHEFYKEL